MKKAQIFRAITWFNRGIILLDLLMVFILPTEINQTNLWAMLAYSAWLLLSLIIAVTWLMFWHHRIFRNWSGWLVIVVVLVISSVLSAEIVKIDSPNLQLFFSLLFMVSSWTIGIATGFLLWYRDEGLNVFAWSSVTLIWVFVFAWRFQGNLIELWLKSLNNPDYSTPLWWMNPLFCILWWVIPISVLSYLGHSIRILTNEINRESQSTRGES